MDVLSLPDEMLVSVTKYMNNMACRKARTLNKRMNLVAKNFGLDRMVLERIKLEYDYDSELRLPLWLKIALQSDDHNPSELLRPDIASIEKLLKMVRKVDQLYLKTDFYDAVKVAEFFRFARELRAKSLDLYFGRAQIRLEQVKNLANELKPSKLEICGYHKVHQSYMSDKVVAEFDPSIHLEFYGITAMHKISILSFRNRIFGNKLMIYLDGCTRTRITFNDMIQFLKEYNTLEGNINFGMLLKEDIYQETVTNTLKECGFIVLKHRVGNIPEYAVNHIDDYRIVRPANKAKISFRIWIKID